MDGIKRDDVGEYRLVGIDEIAHGDELARDPARERRLDLGELEIKASVAKGCLCTIQLGPSSQVIRPALIEKLLGDVVGSAQGLGPLEIVRRELDPDLRRSDCGLGLLERSLIGPLVD